MSLHQLDISEQVRLIINLTCSLCFSAVDIHVIRNGPVYQFVNN